MHGSMPVVSQRPCTVPTSPVGYSEAWSGLDCYRGDSEVREGAGATIEGRASATRAICRARSRRGQARAARVGHGWTVDMEARRPGGEEFALPLPRTQKKRARSLARCLSSARGATMIPMHDRGSFEPKISGRTTLQGSADPDRHGVHQIGSAKRADCHISVELQP